MKTLKTKVLLIALIGTFALGLTGSITALAAGPATVDLGTASNFVILSESGITNIPTSAVTGNIGTTPITGASITGMGCGEVTGTIYTTNAAGPACRMVDSVLLNTARINMEAAYTAASNSVLPAPTVGLGAGTLGGQILAPGIYKWGTNVTIATDITLSGGVNDVWIFQVAGNLSIASAQHVSLAGGANPANIFWQVAGGTGATLGTTSVFSGNILALKQVIIENGATLNGRALAQTLVTLDHGVLTKPTASAVPLISGPEVRNNTITVVKHIINDNSGTATSFPLFVNGTPVVSGQGLSLAPGIYTVTETSLPNYKTTFTGDCNVNGQITHGGINTQNDICVIINDDMGAPIVVPPVPPLIDVVKTASPLSLPAGPGPVTYTYMLRNIGTVPVTNITMVGDTCSPIVRISGDVNSDNKLDVNETWVHTCSTTLSATHTNTVVATGWANGLSAVDVASATVVVGVPIVPPLIHITKVPSPLTLSVGGGLVTYTKRVTNPGTVALSNVRVTDDKCSPIQYISGDVNNDSKLDTAETWMYMCQTDLVKTTANTAVVSGEANGLTARDFAIATVIVATAAPALPNTGFAPDKTGALWNIVALFSVLITVSALSVAVLKKRKI
jgi:uncharacterized repeat protein (TIGR01451 family)